MQDVRTAGTDTLMWYAVPVRNRLCGIKKEDIHMTVSFVIFTIVYGTVSSILGTYIVRILDKKCKNDRHSSDSDR